MPRDDSPVRHQAPDLGFCVTARREFFPGRLKQSECGLIRYIRSGLLLFLIVRALVSKRRLPREETFMDLAAHTLNRAHGPNVIIELSEAGQDRFHKLSLGICVYGLRHRDNSYAKLV